MFSPEEIAARQFLISLRGYDREEVAAFLQLVAEDVQKLQKRVRDLERRSPPRQVDGLKDALRLLGEETTRVLVAAEEAAEQIRQRTDQEARAQLDTAHREAAEEREEAHRQAVEEMQRARRIAAEELDRAQQSAATRLEQARQEAERVVDEASRRRAVLEAGLRDLQASRDRLVTDLQEAVTAVAEVTGQLRSPATESALTETDEPAEVATPAEMAAAADVQATAEADVPPAGAAPAQTAAPAGAAAPPETEAAAPTEAPAETATPTATPGTETELTDDLAAAQAAAEAALVERDNSAPELAQPTDVVEPDVPEDGAEMVEVAPADEVAVEPPAAEPDEPATAGTIGPAVTAATVERLEPGPVVELLARGAVPGVADVASQQLRREVLTAIRPGMLRRLKRTLQDVQNGVLDALRRYNGRGETAPVLPDDDDLAALTSVGEAFLSESYRAGLRDGATLTGRPQTDGAIEPTRIGDSVRAFRDRLGHEIGTSLEATVRVGFEAGEDLPSLSERVSEVFRDLKGPVAETVVDEALLRVYELGALDAWRDAGVAARVWVVGEEPRCPESRCRGNAEEGPVSLDDTFPSGDLVPPAHPGCTCTLAPA